jgi:hypothetical protein
VEDGVCDSRVDADVFELAQAFDAERGDLINLALPEGFPLMPK